jgi:NAD(P)-dependent dehydrogenase (short-subunit alcohol dehydrogenase family)
VSLDQRVCLLTGAGGRLGTTFCREWSSQYQIVGVVGSRKPSSIIGLEYDFDPLAPHEHRTRPLPRLEIAADLTHPGEVERVVRTTLAECGSIDLLVNAAGTAIWGRIEDGHVVETAADQLLLNAIVPLQMAAEVLRQFWAVRPDDNREHNRNIVNVSSSAGVYVYPGSGQSIYAASKAALNHLTCHMADEFASIGIRANAIAPDAFPYIVPTEMVAAHIEMLDRASTTGEVVILPAADEE